MFEILLHNQVKKLLKQMSRKKKEKCINGLERVQKNPFQKRAKCDIKKLSGKKDAYRLRIGNFRFNYVVDTKNNIIYVKEAFRRGRGYR